MKKLLALMFLLATSMTALQAQQKFHTEYSPSFDEPGGGWSKVMQLSNGNTFFLQFNKEDGIQVRVYDKTRKVISGKTFKSGLWEAKRMNESLMEGLYEIKGQPVIFLQQLLERTPTLFRIVLDPQTGAVVSETKLGVLQQYGAFAGYAMAFGGTDPNNSYVEKDPFSDCYAVVYFNGFAHETNKRIEVVHYNGDHQEINRAYYQVPEDKFKYVRFMGMSVDADKTVYLAAFGFNDRSDDDSRIIISALKNGEKEFHHNMLNFSEDFKDTKGVMQYNPDNKLIQLFTITKTSKKHSAFSGKTTQFYLPIMTYIDPTTLSVVHAKIMGTEKVSEYTKAHLGDDDGYFGLPQNMVINNNHTTTILMEQITGETIDYGHAVSMKTELGSIGVSVLNDTGAENAGYAILKKQLSDGIIPTMYLAEKQKGYWSYRHTNRMFARLETNAYMSFDYVNTDKANYILFNDYPVNAEKEEGDKRKVVQAISGSNTMVYKLADGKITKEYLFGKPSDDDKSIFSNIESSSFMKNTNTYATIVVKRDGRDKKAQIAWVTFE